jgi:hypothetical protein
MRVRVLVGVVAAGMLYGVAAAAAEPGESQHDTITVEDALAEPVDPDDAVNIRADDDPDDVGQEGLEPSVGIPPAEAPGAGSDTAPD